MLKGTAFWHTASSGAEKPILQQQELVSFIDKSAWMGTKQCWQAGPSFSGGCAQSPPCCERNR